MVSGLRVEADRDYCVGTGQCVFAAPSVFAQADADGRVVVLDETPGADQHDAVQEAADVCPVAAIRLTFTANTEQGASR